jgi:ElaB/YqjD/DUF883 family membrane-anchored ribosome-binding protein
MHGRATARRGNTSDIEKPKNSQRAHSPAETVVIIEGRGEMMAEILGKPATVDEVLREVSHIKSVVTEAVDDGVRSALRAAKQGREFAEDTIQDTRRAIKRNPLQAAGIFLAAGIVIGSLLTWMCSSRD